MAWLLGSGRTSKQPLSISSKNDDFYKIRDHLMSLQKDMLGVDLPNPQLYYAKGIPLPPPPEKPQLFVPKKLKKIRHVMGSAVGPLFSDTAKDIIEDIEPGVHGFYPVDVEGREERGFTDNYYILNVRSRLKALCLEAPASQEYIEAIMWNPEYQHEYIEDYRLRVKYPLLALCRTAKFGPMLFVRKGLITGRALWTEYGATHNSAQVFASDEFVKRMGRAKFGAFSPDVEVAEVEECP